MANLVTDAFNAIFGSDEEKKNTNTAQFQSQTGTVKDKVSSTTDTKTTQQTGSTQSSRSTTQSDTNTFQQNLSEQDIAAASVALGKLSSDFSPANLNALEQRIRGTNDATVAAADTVLNRALTGDAALQSNLDAILTAARSSGQKAVEGKFQEFSRGAGSKFNTLAAQVFADETSDLETQLAGLGGQLIISNRQAITQELQGALGARISAGSTLADSESKLPLLAAEINSGNAGAIAALVNSLKGGKVTGSSSTKTIADMLTETQTTTNSSSQVIADSLSAKDINLNTNTVGVGKETVTDPTSLLDIIKAL